MPLFQLGLEDGFLIIKSLQRLQTDFAADVLRFPQRTGELMPDIERAAELSRRLINFCTRLSSDSE